MRARRLQTVLLCATILALNLTLLVSQTASAVYGVTVGAPVNVSLASGNQAEATVAVDPTNPLRIFEASNPGTSAAVSSDGGATWTRYSIPNTCCDNVAVFDNFGNLFLVNINSGLNSIDLYLSATGGTSGSFTLLQQIDSGANVDQPTVAVGAGSVWVTWNKAGTIYARGAAVTGLNTIGAFNAIQAAPNSNTVSGQFGDLAIGPSGQVTVSYQNDTQIYTNTDADGLGAGGFGAQVNPTATNVATFDFIPAQSGRSIDAEVGLAYDRSGGAFNGRLYMVYTNESPDESNDTDVLLRTSPDNGATWSAASRVNDDATTRSQFLPHMAIDQTTGVVAFTWYDARNDSGSGAGSTNATANDDAQFWGTISSDGGATFLANFQISAGTSNDNAAASGVDYGDYSWSGFTNGVLYPVWSDNSNSTGDNPNGALSRFDIYAAKVTVTNFTAPPTITVAVTPAANANGWNNTDVVVDWTVTNATSTSAGCADVTLTAETASTILTCDASNPAGSDSVSTREIKIDKTAPVITITTPANGATFEFTAAVHANYACVDSLSGVATCAGPVANGANIDTSTVGPHTFTVNATDNAGNAAAQTVTYTVTGQMYVANIAVFRATCNGLIGGCLKWGVQLKSHNRVVVGGQVSVTITKPNGQVLNLTATTDSSGGAAFVTVADVKGDWTLTVTNASAPNYVYVPALNVITTRSVGYFK
jgi:hypothetical protein